MGLFFGAGRTFSKMGNATFVSGEDGGDTIIHSGNTALSSRYGLMSTNGSTSFLSDGSCITKSGDTYICGGKTYAKCGNTLFGPDGRTWNGAGMTDQDVRDIIAHDR